MGQKWKATWVDEQGKERVMVFESLDTLMIARIDFQLAFKRHHEGPIPERYELEEVSGNVGDNRTYSTGTRWEVLPRYQGIPRKTRLRVV